MTLPRTTLTVLPEWIDHNGHMNVAYYVLAFDLQIFFQIFLVQIPLTIFSKVLEDQEEEEDLLTSGAQI